LTTSEIVTPTGASRFLTLSMPVCVTAPKSYVASRNFEPFSFFFR